jgi:hypothetical protein
MGRRHNTKSIQRENSRLKKKVRQLESAIKALSDDDNKEHHQPKKSPKISKNICPRCKDTTLKTLDLGRFTVECCEACTYRRRIVGGH